MIFRSPHLLDRESSALLVVDLQEKLVPVIKNGLDVVANSAKLIEAASIPRRARTRWSRNNIPKASAQRLSEIDTDKAAIVESKDHVQLSRLP